MSKYGLQLRVQPSQQKKKQPTRPPLRPPIGFRDDDDDDVEREISRQAMKNKSLKDIEEQHKKALEEDPLAFDYDGVYDEMKEKAVLPRVQDHKERKPKYIQKLMEKAKEREREHEIIYERKLAKERSKEDHLFADKDKFVTGAYRKKLAEQAKWLGEERLRQLKEEKEDVTKMSDTTEFYFNLSKNVAFGGTEACSKKPEKQEEKVTARTSEKVVPSNNSHQGSSKEREVHQSETTTPSTTTTTTTTTSSSGKSLESLHAKMHVHTTAQDTPVVDASVQENNSADQPKSNPQKRGEDAVAAAKERFLARKRAKEQ